MSALASIPPAQLIRDRHAAIDQLELAMRQANARGNTAECPLKHTFKPGVYERQVTLPAGVLVTSKIHKTRHCFKISKGRVLVQLDTGVVELKAPHYGITMPGTRRIVYAIEETIWTTYHKTDETDLAVIEAMLIEPREPLPLPLPMLIDDHDRITNLLQRAGA